MTSQGDTAESNSTMNPLWLLRPLRFYKQQQNMYTSQPSACMLLCECQQVALSLESRASHQAEGLLMDIVQRLQGSRRQQTSSALNPASQFELSIQLGQLCVWPPCCHGPASQSHQCLTSTSTLQVQAHDLGKNALELSLVVQLRHWSYFAAVSSGRNS